MSIQKSLAFAWTDPHTVVCHVGQYHARPHQSAQEVKKPANTSTMVWNDRLFALYEADLPYELDPATLETLGRVSITPATDTLLPIVAAHSRVVRQPDGTRRWVAFAAKEAGLDSRLVFQELGEDGAMIQAREVVLKVRVYGYGVG